VLSISSQAATLHLPCIRINFNRLSQKILSLQFMHKIQICPLKLLWIALILFIFSSLAHAQYEDGSVAGTTRDSSGAAISGANISVTSTATGIQNVVTSNGSGGI
jgi:hypothetical protein